MDKEVDLQSLSLSRKRTCLLAAGAELFRQFGFEKVTVDEICEKARTSKMTFYRQFRDKVELSLCLIEKRNLEAKDSVQRLFSEEISFSEKFKALIEMHDKYREEMGFRFLEDLTYSSDPRIISGLQGISRKMEQLSFQFIEMGRAQGFFDSRFKPEFILFLSVQINSIFKSPEMIKFYPDFSERLNAIHQFFYYGVTSKQERAKS